jgi:hypothetical protein
MKKILATLFALFAFVSVAQADNVLVIDAQYDQVTNNVKGRLEAAGHTVTVTTNIASIPTVTSTYQQVWDLRYSAVLTAGEQTTYQTYVTNGGFAYFVTENPGCCQSRNNSVAALITALGGGTTTIGANSAMTNNISSNVNTKYMTAGITVNYAAVSAIVNSQGIPLISDGNGAVSGMSWIGRAGNLGQGVTGTIVTVADTNWLDQSRFNVSGTTAQQQNVTALDDIIKGIVAGTVGGTISANGNGAAAQNGGAPPPKTVVSTAAGTPTVTSSSSNGATTSFESSTPGTTTNVSNAVLGTTVTTSSHSDVSAKNAKSINVTRTTTVVHTTPRTTTITSTTPIRTVTTNVTPRTTTTTTVPVTITTYSDGSTESTNGTPVVTTSAVNITTTTTTNSNDVVVTTVRDSIVQTTASNQTASVSAAGLKDALAVGRFNPFLVDALSTKDGAWITPLMGYAKTGDGSFRTGSIGFGAQKTVEENTLGIAGTFGRSNAHGFVGTTNSSDSYGATVYAVNKQTEIWTKLSVGFGVNEYSTTTALPIFALSNSNKVKANNYYADLTFYSGQEFFGFRPLAGVTLNKSVITSYVESGTPLLSTPPEKASAFEARPYAGVRFDLDENIGFETRAIRSKDFGTVGQFRATAKSEVMKDVFVNVSAGFDKSSNYTAAVGMIGLKVNF